VADYGIRGAETTWSFAVGKTPTSHCWRLALETEVGEPKSCSEAEAPNNANEDNFTRRIL
jgi:hypothetical protein